MNRKQFIEANGATCNNWRLSWSFINEEERIIIFGAWDFQTEGNTTLIFSEDWQIRRGRKQSAYKQSREHIRLIEEEGFMLMTFPMQHSDAKKDNSGVGPAKIKAFTPKLEARFLKRVGGNWYASDGKLDITIPEEVDSSATYVEGASVNISVNSYERNRDARQKCIDHYGYNCKACGFNFETSYGSIGEEFIHVHHVIPIHTVKGEYEVDPIKDLIPVCPNCHAIIHLAKPALTIEELKEHLISRQ